MSFLKTLGEVDGTRTRLRQFGATGLRTEMRGPHPAEQFDNLSLLEASDGTQSGPAGNIVQPYAVLSSELRKSSKMASQSFNKLAPRPFPACEQ
jgi:hypothetical protein